MMCLCGGCVTYNYITSPLPSPNELQQRQFQFQTTTVFDRYGEPLWEINDPNFGRRKYVTLTKISPYLLQATIATEDRNFYENPGVDPTAILRAIYYNVTEGSIVSGGSTITQQVARNVLLTNEERNEQTLSRKIKEAILAVKLANQYSKEQILEVYLNQIYYGNLAYGIEAATETYFGKEPFTGPPLKPGVGSISQTAGELTLAEAALLAGLPQSPAYYDPYNYPERVKNRQKIVLGLMVKAGYITQSQAEAALQEPVLEQLAEPGRNVAVPHFISFVLSELESNPPAGHTNIYESGLQIQTTLDPKLQKIAEEEVAKQVDALTSQNVTNGALVAVSPKSGQIVAMVGSKDFWDDLISGQINMAVSPRQPGSSIKPLVYLIAFEKGWRPGTTIVDEPVSYPDGMGGFYQPMNYDGKFHGAVSARIALANSYNIPVVKTLDFVGVDNFKTNAKRFGLTTLTGDYGLALALGSGEVPLVEMVGAYQAIANGGLRIKPYAIARILDNAGNDITSPRPSPMSAMREEYAYLITNVLADNQARAKAFGENSALKLSRPAAAKTGTTNDFRDNWVLGYTPDLVVGVWVGNANYTPMYGTTGLSGAAPIWHNFMERGHEGVPVHDFIRPSGVIDKDNDLSVTDEVAAHPLPTHILYTFPTVSPTPSPILLISTSIPNATLTPTPPTMPTSADRPTPTETPTAVKGNIITTPTTPPNQSCLIEPGRDFNKLANLWPNYPNLIGCPTDEQITIPTIAEELFQGGHAFWRSDTDEVYVVYDRIKENGAKMDTGRWQTAGNNKWDGSNPDGVGMSPPTGFVEPKRGFGWLWRNYLGGESGPLGWALDKEYGLDNVGQAQRFERGMLFRGSFPQTYILLDNGTFYAP